MPKVEKTLKSVPGVLSVKVSWDTQKAKIGTEKGKPVPEAELLAALEKLKYTGTIMREAEQAQP